MAATYHFLGPLPRIDGDPAPLPTRITLDRVRELAPGSTQLLLGVNEKALVPVGLDVHVDVDRDPHLLIFGDGRPGKSTLLRSYLQEVTRLHTPATAQMFAVDHRRTNLGEFSDEWGADDATNAETAHSLATGLAQFLRDRQSARAAAAPARARSTSACTSSSPVEAAAPAASTTPSSRP